MAEPTPPTIAVASLSTTSVRVTFSDSDGTPTNYVVYALTSDAGNTWIAGGNRSGDGTVDVTSLTPAAEYFFVGYSDDGTGYNSIPSNIETFRIVYNSSNNPTLHMGYPKLFAQPELKEKTRDYTFYQYMYELGVNQTLEQAGLDYGDTLPEDATATIVESSLSKSPGKANGLATIVARFANEWAD